MAIDSASSVSASRSMVMLPSGSAVVPRTMRDVDRKRAVEQILRAVDLHHADEVGGRAGVELAAAVARIGEGVETDAREVAGLAGSDVAVEMGDDALRQVVGLDLARDRQRLQLGHQAPVPADDAPHQAAVGEMVEPALLAVALARGVDEAQAARLADAVGAAAALSRKRASSATAIASGKPMPTKPPVATEITIANAAYRIARRGDFPLSSGSKCRKVRGGLNLRSCARPSPPR